MSSHRQQQQLALPVESRSLLAMSLTLAPLWVLSTQLRSRLGLGLDNLHLGLIQVLLLLVFGRLSSWFGERNQARSATKAERKVSPAIDNGRARTSEAVDQRSATPLAAKASSGSSGRKSEPERSVDGSTQKARPIQKLKSHSLFTPAVCDTIVAKFLAATEPDYLKLLPPSAVDAATSASGPSTPLSDWTILHTAEGLTVRQHPETKKMLYAIQATFPNVPLRKLFEVLTDINQRPKWDGMASGSEEIERFEIGTQDGREVKGALVWLAMKGVALIKAKDMILVSFAGRLPSSADKKAADALQAQQTARMTTSDGNRGDKEKSTDSAAEDKKEAGEDAPSAGSKDDPIRIYCATTSYEHPDHPPKSGYNRMPLGISGFLIEDDGKGGSTITQVTDLSGLGSWVPSAVLRTVTQTMLPKSLTKLGKAAAEFDLSSESKHPLEGTDWLPPVLGAQAPEGSLMTTATDVDDDGSDDFGSDSSSTTLADGDDTSAAGSKLSPASSRDLHTLVAQLRSLTSRLTALEQTGGKAGKGAATAKQPWYSALLGPGAGVEQGVMSRSGTAALFLTTAGGAAGAAVVIAIMKGWEQRRR